MKSGHQRSRGGRDPVASDPTRVKLLEAAGEVFAESGYYAATIREICSRAGANVAAVNYYFGDKLELYTEVLRHSVSAIHPAQKEDIRKSLEQKTGLDEVLKQVIRAMLQAMCGEDRPSLHFRLMVHELAQPTPAMSRVIDEATRPNYDRLREMIGSILGLPRDDEKTRLCTHSIIAQVVHYAHAGPILARLWPEMKMTPAQLEQVANHIAEFSLCYLREAGSKPRQISPTKQARRRK